MRVFFPCTGLGHEQRGFETFTRECAAALAPDPTLTVSVFGGGGALEDGERAVLNLPRSGWGARTFASLLNRDPYFVEQATFFAGFLPALVTGAPDLVYFADLNLGNACWHWRRLSGQRFRLLFYNGGATTRPFTRCDFVQQVSPEHFDAALARGEPAAKQVLLPHGITVADEWRPLERTERERIRAALGVPVAGRLLLSVGMLDATVKRMDAVIRAVSRLPAPRPHLLLLGSAAPETRGVRDLAAAQLGAGCTIATVSRQRALEAYSVADAFVLASRREGFGLAYLEALAAGLPCVAHESATTSYLFGPHAHRGDVGDDATLATLITRALDDPVRDDVARARHAWVRDRFSWKHLAPRYSELLRACAAGRMPVAA